MCLWVLKKIVALTIAFNFTGWFIPKWSNAADNDSDEGSCIKPSKQKTSKELMTAFVGEKMSHVNVVKFHCFEMDRDWMSANKLTVKYREGVDFFLEFSAKNADNPDLVHCPCLKCGNMERMKIAQIREHLFKNGIDRSYKMITSQR
ncbi:hypothetical protein F8388_011810 [Cannabis sativa]|uniref:Transposase-associated domain-containing protein n=1 Tax=Cannabis sativa TaxID=3483 RepID=A0A7J6FJL9_CANSA|nr:hypothetical protein F8388_011810 [Cannabis sativa]